MTPAATAPGNAVHLKALSAGAVKYAVTALAAKFKRDIGDQVAFDFGTIGAVQSRLAGGETADLIIGTAAAVAQMEQSGVILAGSRTELGRTLTGICVRDGAPLPDISTPESFRQTLLDAGSIAYTDPKAGGTSGIFLTGLLARLGIAGAVASKAILCRNGDEVVEKVADGAAAIGSTFISEMLPVRSVKVVGPLPLGIQNATAYAAGISASSRHREAAGRFIGMLVAPAQRKLWIACGFEPAEHA